MLTRISDKKIREVISKWEPFTVASGPQFSITRSVAQAQLEADQEKVKEIFDEIERLTFPDTSGKYTEFSSPLTRNWQAFKKKWGVG